jgi:NADPH:quinone reductase-like Zn-dependent oxidoreductase
LKPVVTQADEFIGSAGLRPIATCSPSNFDLIRRFGAEQVFDYRSPTCAADIRAYTKNELAYALDCITLAETTQLCYESLGRAGGRYVGLEPFRQAVADTRALTVQPSWLMALTIFIETPSRRIASLGRSFFPRSKPSWIEDQLSLTLSKR